LFSNSTTATASRRSKNRSTSPNLIGWAPSAGVLGHITDEDHVGRGPRNTGDRLHQELAENPYTEFGENDDVQGYLDDRAIPRSCGCA
jgi:hypothetical protein